jgi:nitroreductase
VELRDAIRRRRMWRTFESWPVDAETVERILAHGQRAPSAGYAQGFAFLVLQGPDEVQRFWEAMSGGDDTWPGPGVRAAPLVIVPMGSKKAYLDRYAEEDKGWADRDESRWPTPYWLIDPAFASMLILLTAVDEGLGALFFGFYPPTLPAFREAFGVPEEWEPIGGIAIGHRAPTDPVKSSAQTRPRKPLGEIVHRGRW